MFDENGKIKDDELTNAELTKSILDVIRVGEQSDKDLFGLYKREMITLGHFGNRASEVSFIEMLLNVHSWAALIGASSFYTTHTGNVTVDEPITIKYKGHLGFWLLRWLCHRDNMQPEDLTKRFMLDLAPEKEKIIHALEKNHISADVDNPYGTMICLGIQKYVGLI